MDCHEFANANSRNDEFSSVFANAKNTHPQTHFRRGGVLNRSKSPISKESTFISCHT